MVSLSYCTAPSMTAAREDHGADSMSVDPISVQITRNHASDTSSMNVGRENAQMATNNEQQNSSYENLPDTVCICRILPHFSLIAILFTA